MARGSQRSNRSRSGWMSNQPWMSRGGGALAGRRPGTPVAFPGEGDLSADVQADQGDGRAGLEDDVGGAWVTVGVELGVGGYVTGDLDGSAHDDKLLDVISQIGTVEKGLGDVGQGSEGDDYQVAGVFESGVLNEVGGRLGSRLGPGGRYRYAQAAGAVEVVGELELAGQRCIGSPVHGHFGTAQVGHEVEGVASCVFEAGVAADGSQGEDVELGRVECGDEGDGVVGAGVGVDDVFGHGVLICGSRR